MPGTRRNRPGTAGSPPSVACGSDAGRPRGGPPPEAQPLTHTTCFKVWTTSTRSDELAMTVSMSL